MLATAVEDKAVNWDSHLRRLCIAYNSSIQPTTGYTPFYLMFGRQVRMPVDIMYGTPNPELTTPSKYTAELRKGLENAYQQVRELMGHTLNQEKELYDQRVHGQPFKAGDMVWLHFPAVPRGQSKKLHRPWKGPFRIIKRISDVTYRIQNVHKRTQRMVVHFNRLKVYPTNMRPTPNSTSATTYSRAAQPAQLLPLGTNIELVYNENWSTHMNQTLNQATMITMKIMNAQVKECTEQSVTMKLTMDVRM